MMIYYAIACHSSEKYKEAVRAFKTVYPTDTRKDEIVLSYASSLKEVHKYKTARNLILPFYSSTVGDDLIAVIQNMEFTTLLLELDVLLQDEDFRGCKGITGMQYRHFVGLYVHKAL